MEKQYSLHVEFMVTEFPTDGWYSIYHATVSGNVDVYGSRVPGIWINTRNGTMCTGVYSAVGKYRSYYHKTPFNPIKLNKWIEINVSQTKVGGDDQYIIEMNEEVVRTVKNANPRQFENVKIYISDPWYDAVPGEVPRAKGLCRRDYLINHKMR